MGRFLPKVKSQNLINLMNVISNRLNIKIYKQMFMIIIVVKFLNKFLQKIFLIKN